jgi:hypothetical protein
VDRARRRSEAPDAAELVPTLRAAMAASLSALVFPNDSDYVGV